MFNNMGISVRLPNEIYHHVLDELRAISPQDLLATALVNRAFSILSKPHIYRRISLHITGDRRDDSKLLLQRLIADERLGGYVREIQVQGFDRYKSPPAVDPYMEEILDLLLDLITATPAKLRVLERLDYGASKKIPATLVDALARCFPGCKLSMTDFPGYIFPATPSLYELHASVFGGDSNPRMDPLGLTQRTILNAPNLRSLKITIIWANCVVIRRLTEFPTETLSEGDTYPPLEILHLHGYICTPRGVDGWMKAMDWSHLHTLKIEHCRSLAFFQVMAPAKIPQLASFKLVFGDFDSGSMEEYLPALRIFLLGASEHGLENLDLQVPGYPIIWRDVVTHHASTLMELTLHEKEHVGGVQRTTLSVEDLLWLDTTCENLKTLAIDVNPKFSLDKNSRSTSGNMPDRSEDFPDFSAHTDMDSPPDICDTTWPEDILATLTSSSHFRHLRSLKLLSLIGISTRTSLVSPSAFHKALYLLAHSRKLTEGGLVLGECSRVIRRRSESHKLWVSWEYKHWGYWVVSKSFNGENFTVEQRGGGRSRSKTLAAPL